MDDYEFKFSQINTGAEQLRTQLTELQTISQKFGTSLSSALSNSIIKGKSFSNVLREMGLSMSRIALRAAMQPIQAGVSSFIGNLATKIIPFAKGGMPNNSGIISQPGYFPLGRNTMGVAGEAGSEAILPLARGADGRLGVKTNGNAAPISIVFNVSTADAQSFDQAESQISAMLARAVGRGQRGL